MEIILSIFSDNNIMKVEINNRRKTGKFTKMWKLNNIPLKNQWVKKELKMEIKTVLIKIKIKTQHTKLWNATDTVLRENT